MINRYNKGSRLERDIRHYLEAKGFYTCRSAGSHGEIDLIADDGTHEYRIQVKANIAEAARLKLLDSLLERHSGYRFISPLVLTKDFRKEMEGII